MLTICWRAPPGIRTLLAHTPGLQYSRQRPHKPPRDVLAGRAVVHVLVLVLHSLGRDLVGRGRTSPGFPKGGLASPRQLAVMK